MVMSIDSVTDRNPTPLQGGDGIDQMPQGPAQRANHHTTNVSPAHAQSNAAANSGRLADAWSVNTRQHSACSGASSCNAASCSAVETRAYPTKCPTGLGFPAAGRLTAGRGAPGAGGGCALAPQTRLADQEVRRRRLTGAPPSLTAASRWP